MIKIFQILLNEPLATMEFFIILYLLFKKRHL